MGHLKGLFRGLHPVAERGPEEIGIVVFIPSFQREQEGSVVSQAVLPHGHDGVQRKLDGPKGSLKW
jgi:hypothetical protein